jgi:conjugative relaxase-like TrwC/TraI family protein
MYAVWKAEDGQLAEEPVGIQYRQDTDQRLAELLHFNPNTQPSMRVITRLMEARDAHGQRVPGHRPQSNAFIDLTFSAGKDASVAWAFASAPEKAVIFAAHTQAIDAAMRQIEADIGQVRRGFHDRLPPQPGHITWVQFHHETARPTGHPGDPLLHTHVIVPNIVLSKTSNEIGCLASYGMHGRVLEYRHTYYREFASRMQALGIKVEYDSRVLDVKLPEIPTEVSEAFSKRSAETERAARDHAAKRGVDYDRLTEQQRHRSLRIAGEVSRRSKDISTADHASWQRQANELGWKWQRSISRALRQTISLGLRQEQGIGVPEVKYDDEWYGPKMTL